MKKRLRGSSDESWRDDLDLDVGAPAALAFVELACDATTIVCTNVMVALDFINTLV